MQEDKPIEYVVNIKTGEAIMTDRTKNLVYHDIVKWNPEHECFTFEDKYSYILEDKYIDSLMDMLSTSLKIDSAFDNILKGGKKIKNQKNLSELNSIDVFGDNKNKPNEDKYHYSILTNDFLLKIYQHHYQFFHKVNGNYIKYKHIKNSMVYKFLRTYIIDFFKKSVETILDKGKVGTLKEGILFSKIVEQYKDKIGFVSDSIYIRCKNGLTCVIKSNLVNRFYYFYKGRQNPDKQKCIRFQPDGVNFMMRYLNKNLKEKKTK